MESIEGIRPEILDLNRSIPAPDAKHEGIVRSHCGDNGRRADSGTEHQPIPFSSSFMNDIESIAEIKKIRILPPAAYQHIVTGSSGQDVVSAVASNLSIRIPDKNVVPATAIDQIIARISTQRIITFTTEQFIVAFLSKDSVIARITHEQIVSFVSLELIVSIAAEQRIVVRATYQKIVICTSVEFIQTVTSDEKIISRIAEHHIIAGFSVELIGSRSGTDVIVPFATKSYVITFPAEQRIITGAGK
jgi:hypothetical protein